MINIYIYIHTPTHFLFDALITYTTSYRKTVDWNLDKINRGGCFYIYIIIVIAQDDIFFYLIWMMGYWDTKGMIHDPA